MQYKYTKATIYDLIASAESIIKSPTWRVDAEVLLSFVLKVNRTYLHTWPEKVIDTSLSDSYHALLRERATGVPVAYLTGSKEFWNLELIVNKNVLIPRPDTEILVAEVLDKLPIHAKGVIQSAGVILRENVIPSEARELTLCRVKILDLGTGSGAIALAIAANRPNVFVYAVDKSIDALAVALQNSIKLNIKNIEFLHGDWFSPFINTEEINTQDVNAEVINAEQKNTKEMNIHEINASLLNVKQKFDFIVANPPYITPGDPHLQSGEIRFEPEMALVSQNNGLEDIKHIVTNSKLFLNSNGWLFIEHGYDQADLVFELFLLHSYKDVQFIKDLAGIKRVVYGRTL